MSKRVKIIICSMLFVLFASLLLAVATYAYFSTREIYEGTFEVDVTSKGVDTLSFEKKDAKFTVNASNFAIDVGHDVSGTGTLNVLLETTNRDAKYCYVNSLELPSEGVFQYTVEGVPELVLDIYRSFDGVNFESVIENMDITTKTGVINIPVSKGSSEYKNIISTTKNVPKTDYWQAKITFKWLKDAFQSENDEKTYKAVFKANRVEC